MTWRYIKTSRRWPSPRPLSLYPKAITISWSTKTEKKIVMTNKNVICTINLQKIIVWACAIMHPLECEECLFGVTFVKLIVYLPTHKIPHLMYGSHEKTQELYLFDRGQLTNATPVCYLFNPAYCDSYRKNFFSESCHSCHNKKMTLDLNWFFEIF